MPSSRPNAVTDWKRASIHFNTDDESFSAFPKCCRSPSAARTYRKKHYHAVQQQTKSRESLRTKNKPVNPEKHPPSSALPPFFFFLDASCCQFAAYKPSFSLICSWLSPLSFQSSIRSLNRFFSFFNCPSLA